MNVKILPILLVFALSIHAFTESPEEKQKRRLDIVSYGIESEVTDLIKSLVSEKDTSLNEHLKVLLGATKNQKLSEMLLRFYGDTKWPGAGREAIGILENRDNVGESLVLAAFYYCYMSKNLDALPVAREIFKEDNKTILPAVVKYFGTCGGTEEEELLIAYFEKDIPDSLKQEIILALGGMGSGRSVAMLIGILDNTDSNKTSRMFAADSLGKLKDTQALEAILKATRDVDANMRQYAIGAAAQFDTKEVRDAILEGFRDSNVKVRLESAKAAARLKIVEAIPFLVYKARNDPEKKMKEDAFKALAEIRTAEASSFLDEYLREKKNPLQFRELCWSLLLKQDRVRSLPLLREILEVQALEKDPAFFLYMAREISLAEGDDLGGFAEILFRHSQFTARICGLEYVKKNKLLGMRPIVEGILKNDSAEPVKKKAKDVLDNL